MTEPDRAFAPLPPPLPKPLPVLPGDALPVDASAETLAYYRPLPHGPARWVTVAFLPNSGLWHISKAALAKAKIESLMGEGEDVAPGAKGNAGEGIALKVPQADVSRAIAILSNLAGRLESCPRCASLHLRRLPLPLWWIILSLPFLGVPPVSANRWECVSCGHRGE